MHELAAQRNRRPTVKGRPAAVSNSREIARFPFRLEGAASRAPCPRSTGLIHRVQARTAISLLLAFLLAFARPSYPKTWESPAFSRAFLVNLVASSRYLMKSISEYFGSGQRSSATMRSRRSATSRVAAIAVTTVSRMYLASSRPSSAGWCSLAFSRTRIAS
jgi:hypothetical protein